MDSLILAVHTSQPDFDFAAVDVVSDRRPLRKLYGFVTGEPEAFEFGVELVGNTALFIRFEKQTREELPSKTFHGYRQAFEEQYTQLLASAKGSTSHHHIVRYGFGGFGFARPLRRRRLPPRTCEGIKVSGNDGRRRPFSTMSAL